MISATPSSCSFGQAFVYNHNQNATEIHLSGNNFKVIDQVSGSSEAHYVCVLGAIYKRQLYENAYSSMMNQANLLNCSKAIINVMTEELFSGFAPFLVRKIISVSAQVVEFTR